MDRIVTLTSVVFPKVCLSLDGTGVNSFNGNGVGKVACQYGHQTWEMLRLIEMGNGKVAFQSVAFQNIFLRCDGTLVQAQFASHADLSCQYEATAQDWELFKIVNNDDGTVSIMSNAFPDVFLGIDGTGLTSWQGSSGRAYCRRGRDTTSSSWEKFYLHDVVAKSSLTNWTESTLSSSLAPTNKSLCAAFEKVFVGKTDGVSAYDMVSGEKMFDASTAMTNVKALVPYEGAVLAFADDGVFSVAPDSGSTTSVHSAVPNLIWADHSTDGCFAMGNQGGLFRYALQSNGNIASTQNIQVASSGTSLGWINCEPVVGSGRVIVAGGLASQDEFFHPNNQKVLYPDAHMYIYDAQSLTLLQTVQTNGVILSMACDGAHLVIVIGRSIYIYLMGRPIGEPKKIDFSADIAGKPILNGPNCYVPLGIGTVQTVDMKTASVVATHQLPDVISGPGVVNENGILFFPSRSSILILDPASNAASGGEQFATYATPTLGSYVHGALFYSDYIGVTAARLDNLMHSFYVESCLIEDYEFKAGQTAPTKKPNYQVDISITAPDGTPRALQPIRIESNGSASIRMKHRGTEIALDAGRDHVDLTTDESGRLRLAVEAGAAVADTFCAGFGVPELVLSSTTIDPNMRLVVRPDAPSQTVLASITETQLANAKSYDGQSIIKAEYANDVSIGHVTDALKNVAGMIVSAGKSAKKRDQGSMYCHVDCDSTVVCCVPANALDAQIACDQSSKVSFSATGVTTTIYSDETEAAAAQTAMTAGSIHRRDLFSWDLLRSGLKFAEIIVRKASNAVSATFTVIENAISTAYTVTVETIEQAGLIVQGIFNTISKAIDKVIEALSVLFDWGAILKVQETIATEVESAWRKLIDANYDFSLSKGKAKVTSALLGVKKKKDDALAGLTSNQDLQRRGQDSAKAPVGGTQKDWMTEKFKTHGLPSYQIASGRKRSEPQSTWPTIELGDDLTSLLADFLDKLGETIKDSFAADIARLKSDLNPSSGKSLAERSFYTIVNVLNLMADVAIDVTSAAASLAFDLLTLITKKLLEVMTQTIDIIYIKDFFEWVSGGKSFNLLNLFSLLVAIPTHFAMSASGVLQPAILSPNSKSFEPGQSTEPAQSTIVKKDSVKTAAKIMAIAAGCAQIVWGGIAITLPFWQDQLYNVAAAVRFGALLVVRGSLLAAGMLKVGGWSWIGFTLWLPPTLATMFNLSFCWKYSRAPATGVATPLVPARPPGITDWLFALIGPVVNMLLGVALALIAIVFLFEEHIGVAALFPTMVAIGLSLRLLTSKGMQQYIRVPAIVASGFFIALSGGWLIYQGSSMPGS